MELSPFPRSNESNEKRMNEPYHSTHETHFENYTLSGEQHGLTLGSPCLPCHAGKAGWLIVFYTIITMKVIILALIIQLKQPKSIMI